MIDFVKRVKAEVPVPVGVKIVVDGAEGGTGAASMSLTDHMRLPLQDALIAVDDAYRRWGVRDRVTIIGAGRIVTGAGEAHAMVLGAASCSRSAASKRCAATPTSAPPAWRRRARGGSAASCRRTSGPASRTTRTRSTRI
ncbi:MAG: hypothetical protein EXR68_07655 [Dehalococcoidia bacterium]|nr:hypothetical protein [Dehalococcoidia bacterium]